MTRKLLVIGILISLLIVAGLAFGQREDNTELVASPRPSVTPVSFTLETIAVHSTENDCWLAIHDKVYDATQFIPQHPGGKFILEGCGKDATELFETRPMGSKTPHSQTARELLEKHYIGDLVQEIIVSSPPPGAGDTCQNLCGDGVCQEIVCEALGCPCAETPDWCPQDCPSKIDSQST